jgi:hypothetical protein
VTGAKPKPKPSGRSLTTAERKDNGLLLLQGLWLPEALVEKLKEVSDKLAIPRTRIVREALEVYLARLARSTKKPLTGKGEG